MTREARTIVYAGLAGLGEDVAVPVRDLLDVPDLTVRERLWLAIAAARLGDTATALRIERALLAASGEQLGDAMRLRGPSPTETAEGTALIGVIAALVGDGPIADGAVAYATTQPSDEVDVRLETAVALDRLVPSVAPTAARVAWSVGGGRHVVDLVPGRTLTLSLTATQRRSLVLEELEGSVGVATSWEEPIDPAALRPAPALALVRQVTPAGTLPSDGIVEVVLTATFTRDALRGGYEVVELAPSGLAPLPGFEEAFRADRPYVSATAVEGQRVRFSFLREGRGTETVRLRYLARVVTAGTYAWEPAVLRLATAPGVIALTPPTTATIR